VSALRPEAFYARINDKSTTAVPRHPFALGLLGYRCQKGWIGRRQ
jgi:hypothetical protein